MQGILWEYVGCNWMHWMHMVWLYWFGGPIAAPPLRADTKEMDMNGWCNCVALRLISYWSSPLSYGIWRRYAANTPSSSSQAVSMCSGWNTIFVCFLLNSQNMRSICCGGRCRYLLLPICLVLCSFQWISLSCTTYNVPYCCVHVRHSGLSDNCIFSSSDSHLFSSDRDPTVRTFLAILLVCADTTH